ncbi:MAG: hypothetical protein Q7K16_01335 [Candidatus Azambacteria bacterium]|nr:hypothetical protein [Candidatus Azambacteria bacterium]
MFEVFWIGALFGINDSSTVLAASLIFSKNGTTVLGKVFSPEIALRSGLGIGNTGTFNSFNNMLGFSEDVDDLGDSTDNCIGANVCSDFDCCFLKDIRINKPTNTDKIKTPQMIIILIFVIMINTLEL